MGTDYRVHIHRKCDDKELGCFYANQLKTIMDSEFADKIGCEGRGSADGMRFEYSGLEEIIELAWKKLESWQQTILKKEFQICNAKNKDIKHDLEEDIYYIQEDHIKDLKWVILNASFLEGMINIVVEDLIKKTDKLDENGEPYDKAAYEYNGADLPVEKRRWPDGTEYDDPQHVRNSDVYCVIEAC